MEQREKKILAWKPVSEYTGGCVLTTNGHDILIGEINSDGDCECNERPGLLLCGITHFMKIKEMLPEHSESEDERIRKALIEMVHDTTGDSLWVDYNVHKEECIAWLEKQGQTFTKKDVDDAYLKGVCDTKHELEKQGEQKPAEWSEEDEAGLGDALWAIKQARTIAKDENDMGNLWYAEDWLKSLRPQNRWKPSDEQMKALYDSIPEDVKEISEREMLLNELYKDLRKEYYGR